MRVGVVGNATGMRYHALACDYDGTLARDGTVDDQTVSALERVRASGRRLLLVSGRELEDLERVFDCFDLFDRCVLENGALLYRPESREAEPLAPPPPEEFVAALRERGVDNVSVGRSIVATWHPHETTCLEVIRDLGLELEIIFNKGAVMVLPSGINKATGLRRALAELSLSPHNTAGIGDAENDHAFLSMCECAVAVANALPALRERCDWVVGADHGAGVVELVDALVDEDLANVAAHLDRQAVTVGRREDGEQLRIPPYGSVVLVAGPSGAGKSTFASGLLERASQQGFQFCMVDPEGDYEQFVGAVTIGDSQRPPNMDEVMELLADPHDDVVISLLGVPVDDRPAFFHDDVVPRLEELRARTGRPHWMLVDEAHQFFPTSHREPSLLLDEPAALVLVTVHPQRVAPVVLSQVTCAIAVGEDPEDSLRAFASAVGEDAPALHTADCAAVVWPREPRGEPFGIRPEPTRAERHRHRRKYAEGELAPERSFYFTGPDGALNLRAQNLFLFLQVGEGVDDETWLHHLRNGDYARWFDTEIKDEELSALAAELARDESVSAERGRERIRAAVEERYTLPV